MKNIIKVNVSKKEDLLEVYDSNSINKKLIEYLIFKAKNFNKKDNLKIVINYSRKTNINIKQYLLNSLFNEFQNIEYINQKNNILQFIFLLVGISFLFLSTTLNKNIIFKEIFIIIGWVPIWRMAQLELFDDFTSRKRKKIIKKLMESEYIIIKKEN